MELRSTMDVPTPVSQSIEITSTADGPPEITTSSVPSENRVINIDFSMKISKKSELLELLKIFQNQINIIKMTIDRLIEISSESDEDIHELQLEEISQTQRNDQGIQFNEESHPKPFKMSKDIKIDESELTALPPKPESLIKEGFEEIGESTLKPAPKLKTKARTKKELKNERQGLETKLKSVQDLLEFIDKKHLSGKIADNEFSKRSKKLQNDVKKTKKKISVLNKLLEK
jgi:hypothetical protein